MKSKMHSEENVRFWLMKSLGFGLVLMLTACVAIGPDYEKPQLEAVERAQSEGFTKVYDTKTQSNLETEANSIWQSFEDTQLNRLLALALAQNTDTQIALANLKGALATDRDAWLDLLPQPLTQGAFREKQDSKNRAFPAEKNGDAYQEHSLTQSFSWELDWLGRVTRLNQSTRANVEAIKYQAEQIKLVTLAQVTRQYVLLRGTQSQLRSTKANAQRQKETWDLTQSRLDAGVATPIDVARAKSQYFATLATVAPLEATQKRALHRLSVLTGRAARETYTQLLNYEPMPELPSVSADHMKVERVLGARPDILSAEAYLRKATAEIGMAQALFYPQITLATDIGFESENFDQLTKGSSVFSLLGVNIRWAGLGFSRVRVLTARARANTEAAYAVYQKTVLEALESVENALVAHQSAQSVTSSLAQSAHAAKRSAQLAQQRYEGGVIGFLEVLDAERRQLEIENQLANARTQQALAGVDLYLSLAVR